MKKIKLLFVSALASAFVFLVGSVAPLVAFAEESVEAVESSEIVSVEEVVEETESVENDGIFEQKTYVWEEDGNKLELTLLNETTAEGKLYVYGTYSATINFLYTYIESDVIELHFPDDSYFESYRLHPNGYLIEYDDGVYIPPDIDDSEVEEETKLDFDDILEFAGTLAEKEGWGDEWEKALYHIQTAASEKKVDTMIVLIALVLAFLTIYAIVKLVKHKLSNAKIRKIVESLTGVEDNGNAQTKAINGLIDEAEKVEGVATDSVRREKALANALGKQNVAIRCLIRGTNIKQDLKDEAFRSLNESDDLCDEAKK